MGYGFKGLPQRAVTTRRFIEVWFEEDITKHKGQDNDRKLNESVDSRSLRPGFNPMEDLVVVLREPYSALKQVLFLRIHKGKL